MTDVEKLKAKIEAMTSRTRPRYADQLSRALFDAVVFIEAQYCLCQPVNRQCFRCQTLDDIAKEIG